MQGAQKKSMKNYNVYIVESKCSYLNESDTKVFNNFDYAYDCFMLNKSEMIKEMRNDDEYNVISDEKYAFTAEYDELLHSLTLKGFNFTEEAKYYTMFNSSKNK